MLIRFGLRAYWVTEGTGHIFQLSGHDATLAEKFGQSWIDFLRAVGKSCRPVTDPSERFTIQTRAIRARKLSTWSGRDDLT